MCCPDTILEGKKCLPYCHAVRGSYFKDGHLSVILISRYINYSWHRTTTDYCHLVDEIVNLKLGVRHQTLPLE